MKNKNIVVLDKRDEWSKFSEFMAGIYAKYADEVGLDDLPDPFDPSYLELGDQIHMKDGDVINFL